MKELKHNILYVAIGLLISCGGQIVPDLDGQVEYVDVEEVMDSVVVEEVVDSTENDSMATAYMPSPVPYSGSPEPVSCHSLLFSVP